MQACLLAGNTLQRHLPRRGRAVKHVQACLSERKDRESCFQYCGSIAKSGVSMFMGGSARKDRESSFDHCGGPVKLVQACLYAGNFLQRRFDL